MSHTCKRLESWLRLSDKQMLRYNYYSFSDLSEEKLGCRCNPFEERPKCVWQENCSYHFLFSFSLPKAWAMAPTNEKVGLEKTMGGWECSQWCVHASRPARSRPELRLQYVLCQSPLDVWMLIPRIKLLFPNIIKCHLSQLVTKYIDVCTL